MTVQIHLATLNAMAAFAGREQARPQINGVHIITDAQSTTYVATNGHILAARIIKNPEGHTNATCGNWTIPTDECKAFKLNKRERDVTGEMTFANGKITLSYGNTSRTFAPVELEFPNWRMVIPSTVSGTISNSVRFNGDYIATIQEFGERLDLGASCPHWNGDAASVFTFSYGGDSAFCLLMPMRSVPGAAEWSLPTWVNGPQNLSKAA